METFCELRNGLRLELHDKMVGVVAKLVQMTHDEVARRRALMEDVRAKQAEVAERREREEREEREENGGMSTGELFEEFVGQSP